MRFRRSLLLMVCLAAFRALTVFAQTIDEFPVTTAGAEPLGIVVGPDNNFWFTEFFVGKIGRITTGGTVTEFPAAGNPQLLVLGNDGNFWFPEQTVYKIGRMTPTGDFTDFPILTPGGMVGIGAGSDGNVWFCESANSKIGRITPTGTVTEFPVPSGGFPLHIVGGPDGNLWFTNSDTAQVTRLTTAGVFTEFPTNEPGSSPQGITIGPDGNIWFTDTGAVKIGRITPTGAVTEFPIPSGNANLLGIATGPDGNLWFAEDDANKIGRITPNGVVTEFSLPTADAAPVALVAGPDGNLWFTETNANNIGRVNMSALQPQPATVDAHGVAGSNSNVNGVLEPGETVEVSPTWKNTGGGAASFTGTAATLTGPAGATYTIGDASANYGTVGGGATANCHDASGDCYLVTVSNPATRPVPHWDAVLTENLSLESTKWARAIHIGNSFADVPTTHPFYAFIENLFHSGATGGCGGGNYCPSGTVTRAQMAVFLLKGKFGSSHVPPPCTGVFADVPCPSLFADWIEELAAQGITAGCGGGYCPNNPVTRAQMAVFLLKSEHGAAYTPPACVGVFGDVLCPSQFADWVEQLAAEGITAGCGNGNYCPDDPNIRGQMAVFLVKVYGMNLYGP